MIDLNSIPALSEEELETLAELLENEAERSDSFDFFAVHGFLTGLLTGPVESGIATVMEAAFHRDSVFSAILRGCLLL